MEPFHDEAQGALGWAQDQGRLWPGCQRHALTILLAYSVLVRLEQSRRRQAPRHGR
jgi:hypothetical protein